jgi:hypothetical protein
MTKTTEKKIGRPLKFKTVKDLATKIEDYFNKTKIEDWTITGLAIHLDTFRDVLIDYGSGKYDTIDGTEDKTFSNTIKKAKHMVEHSYELDLKKHGRTGTIFALKNFDWKDKSEVDQNVKGTISLSDLFDKAKE